MIKRLTDFLKENNEYECKIDGKKLKFTFKSSDIPMVLFEYKGKKYHIDTLLNVESEIEDILESDDIEIRFCEECGKPMDKGYTVDGGFYYCCEECFEPTMDRDYGQGNWRGTEEINIRDGFYEYLEDGDWIATALYYTKWND